MKILILVFYLWITADVHDVKTRSYNMSRRATNTKPEMLVRKFLHAQGFRYKLHDKTLPGKPDLVFKYKTVIFIHACLPVGRVVSDMNILTADASLGM